MKRRWRMGRVILAVMLLGLAALVFILWPKVPRWRIPAKELLGFVPALGTMPWRWNWKTLEDKRRMMWFLPQGLGDLAWWPLLSLVAGIGEEIVYRGVMFALWSRILASQWAAMAICIIVFSLAHFVQGWKSMVLIALIAAAFHLIVLDTGDLYTAMAGHFFYDLGAGFIILHLGRKDGLARNVQPDAVK
jgi:membrane protease YdiL (CAAX protease family)